MCRGLGNLLYFLCLISNTLPQLEPSSLQPSTVLHHRYLLHPHLLLISREENRNRLRPPPPPLSRGLRSQKGLRPFNSLQHAVREEIVLHASGEPMLVYLYYSYYVIQERTTYGVYLLISK